jgi:hypothetical protein
MTKFSRDDIVALRQRAYDNENYNVALFRAEDELVFTFDAPGVPHPSMLDEQTARYLAINYVSAGSVPDVIKCSTVEEAHHFLGLLESQSTLDYGKVLELVAAVNEEGWRDAVYRYANKYTTGLPIETDGMPFWLLEGPLSGFEDAEMVTTVAESSPYGHFAEIALPEDENALLVYIIFDDNEAEVELSYILETYGIDEDSLEEFLAEQLLYVHKNYAYVRYCIIVGIWLPAVPENEEFLDVALDSRDFKRYYHEYVGYNEQVSEREAAYRNWLDASGVIDAQEES